jgi:hypothetical protein
MKLYSPVTIRGSSTREYRQASDNEVGSPFSSPLSYDIRRPVNLPVLGVSGYRSRKMAIKYPAVK